MATRVRDFDALVDDIQRLADIRNNDTRHPQADVVRMANESIQRMREIISENGHEYYLTSTSSTIAAGANSISLPSGCLRVYGLDMIDQGRQVSLDEWQFAERNDYGGAAGPSATLGRPQAWRAQGDGLALIPPADATYTYVLWYLPALTDYAYGSGATVDGFAGWEEWVVWDCCCKIAVRDKNDKLYALASSERAKLEQFMTKTAPRRSRRASHRLDRRGRRRLSAIERWLLG